MLEEIKIQNIIYEIRDKQVMLDSDLAKLYDCKNGTKDINKAVKRNLDRFPDDFYFELNNDVEETVTNSSDRISRIDFDNYNQNQQKIIRLLLQGQCHIDEMMRELDLDSGVISTELLMLELGGMINKLDGNIYELTI